MVIGIGTDVLRPPRLAASSLEPGDAFFERAFTPAEREQAAGRADAHEYLAGRFAAKEAAYKAIAECGKEFHPGDFEILDDANGHPHATLRGRTAEEVERAWGPGVAVLVSISHEDDLTSAFALAQME